MRPVSKVNQIAQSMARHRKSPTLHANVALAHFYTRGSHVASLVKFSIGLGGDSVTIGRTDERLNEWIVMWLLYLVFV